MPQAGQGGPDALQLHSDEAEQSVLGALLRDNTAWDRIGDLTNEGDFFVYEHRLIYRALSKMIGANKPADVITLSESMKRTAELETVGGFQYLHLLAENSPSVANIRMYAQIVAERASLRRLHVALTKGIDTIFHPGDQPIAEVIDGIQAQVMAAGVTQSSARGGLNPVSAGLTRVMEQLDTLAQSGGSNVTGIATGFGELDHDLAGMQPGDLVVLAARPSMGKTAMLCNITEHVALSLKLPVAVFSMEMSEDQLAMRLLAALSGVNSQRLRVGRLNSNDWDKLGQGLAQLHDCPIFLDEQGALPVSVIRARARKLWREQGGKLGLIAIDYLQLMRGEEIRGRSSGENRVDQLSEITRGLKALAKELQCPVLLLSQLNRGVESRPNKRPMMSDLRESGAIEQDADVILFIYRDEYYNQETPDKGKAEIIISKQRNGPIGTVKLGYRGDNTRFFNLV